jgi:hypothetical protein
VREIFKIQKYGNYSTARVTAAVAWVREHPGIPAYATT